MLMGMMKYFFIFTIPVLLEHIGLIDNETIKKNSFYNTCKIFLYTFAKYWWRSRCLGNLVFSHIFNNRIFNTILFSMEKV